MGRKEVATAVPIPHVEPSTKVAVAIDEILTSLEIAELELSNEGDGRRDTGSYYTPADVADHFWRLFLRHQIVIDAPTAKRLLADTHFVEPSVGAGMFFFSLVRRLLALGLLPRDVAKIRFEAIDINAAALEFVRGKLAELEVELGVKFAGVSLTQADFLDWIKTNAIENPTFVGNPPFVANARGSRWKNLYADFVETMLESSPGNGRVSLILPISMCFSRDYLELRRIVQQSGLPLSASSYDNIPDCLFKAGKPESGNTNKANSQRCTILNLGGPRNGVVESSALLRWSAGSRQTFLNDTPTFHDCSKYDIVRQIPRPAGEELTSYLETATDGLSAREFMSRIGSAAFAVGGVARNFIGIRDFEGTTTGVIPIRTNERDSSLILLQVLASSTFYQYWRSFGDGFHVTNDLIDRFPISRALLRRCEENLGGAKKIWAARKGYAKTKLNSGKLITSYDFTPAFADVR